MLILIFIMGVLAGFAAIFLSAYAEVVETRNCPCNDCPHACCDSGDHAMHRKIHR